ncbi:MAG: TRAP transporter large permease subunit [Chloroflexi bacterium]|jgi:tripartite ATP-independent transporter DctM subunit|uniref:C4-dicarboxylate ABC transporter n=1 Tax=Candidatus Thermofonsia Clade 3 bacterium TaxID=2364212 RepID=A0A2M8QEW6_9CHLR|nr:TRAP transporter large permease subunit [Candidatus Roseilinea sp. NK_OTU-006]PJF48353.1 MAG: C4-dicarboxylate ABC transporter [Candidatus Thermofonsia Clade 3 bacterium]RMG62282.1 MAG: TRAP transporter large permease subunit [Chloroflexota bacterium]
MEGFNPQWLGILMFVGFFFLLLTGYPVAFSFAGVSIVFGLIGLAMGAFDFNLLLSLPNSWFGIMSDSTLLAIPFFIFMGAILEKSGLAEELLETVGQLMGPLKGGIALAVVVVGTLLAATTGVVAATIIAMGLISLPTMLKYGYNKELATGVIVASGTMAQMIPPSIVLVLLSDQFGLSIGDLFAGALVPGLLLAASYAIYALVVAYTRPGSAPALPPEARTLSSRTLLLRTLRAFVPPVVLILAVLGTIFAGLATPSEAGAFGAIGASILAVANRRMSRKVIADAALSTAKTTGLVLMILFASTLFTKVLFALGSDLLIEEWLTNLPGGFWTFIIVANIAIFLLGIFLEFTEITYIAMPLLVPAAERVLDVFNPTGAFSNEGYTMVWFAIVVAINLQTAFISPPVGFSLFYMQSVAPKEVSTVEIHRSAIPFMIIQLVVLAIVIAFPETVNALVRLSFR